MLIVSNKRQIISGHLFEANEMIEDINVKMFKLVGKPEKELLALLEKGDFTIKEVEVVAEKTTVKAKVEKKEEPKEKPKTIRAKKSY